jgi:flavodoxin
MRALVVVESSFGNTRTIARAIAERRWGEQLATTITVTGGPPVKR